MDRVEFAADGFQINAGIACTRAWRLPARSFSNPVRMNHAYNLLNLHT
ncbi:hypothetical protein L570_0546 [Bordetella pertussis 2356847]|nr:hypothetical protein L570_0546 [Bordetella pertussis 2356847]